MAEHPGGFKMLSKKEAKKLQRTSAKEGSFVSVPTKQVIQQRHEAMKNWFEPRDKLIEKFLDILLLREPYEKDKANKDKYGTKGRDGEIEFTTATFPFDIVTLGMSAMASKYPIVTTIPRVNQTDKQAKEFERFAQGIMASPPLELTRLCKPMAAPRQPVRTTILTSMGTHAGVPPTG